MSIAFQQNFYTYQHITPYVPYSDAPYQVAIQQMTVGQTMAFQHPHNYNEGKQQSCSPLGTDSTVEKETHYYGSSPTYNSADKRQTFSTHCASSPIEKEVHFFDSSPTYTSIEKQQFDTAHPRAKENTNIQHHGHVSDLFPYGNTSGPSHPRLCLPNISASDNFAENVMSEESDLGYYSFSDIGDVKMDDMTSEEDNTQTNFSNIIDEVLDSLDADISSQRSAAIDAFNPPKTVKTNTISYLPCAYQNVTAFQQNTRICSLKQAADTRFSLKSDDVIFNLPIPPQQITQAVTSYLHDQSSNSNTCTLCSKSFTTKLELTTHLRHHKTNRPHKCSYCNKSFTQKSTLRTHERTHTGERPYCCQYCTRAFGDYSTYRKHVRTHTGEKPYTCDVCKKSFTQSGNMIRHREIHFKHLKNV